MDSFLHNIYEVCVDGLHFTEWKHFLCIFIRFSSGMERKGGEEGRRVGEGRVSVQEHKREGAQDGDRQFEGKKIIFSLTLCVQSPCRMHVNPHRRPQWCLKPPGTAKSHLSKRGF